MANPSRLEKIQITGNTNSGTATKVNVQEANGEVNTQTINTGFNKNIGLGGSDVVGANTLLNQYATTPSDWTATAFNSGQVVFYAGKQWISKTTTVAGDVPSVSSKWEEITFEALANKTVTVDQTIIDGSTNAVAGNAVFDGLDLKANLASPALTGTPTAPTPTTTTGIANKSYVDGLNSGNVKLTGNQSVSGIKTFTNPSLGGTILSLINNGAGDVFDVVNNSTGHGINVVNTSSGVGCYSLTGSSGNSIVSNALPSSTGFNYVGQNNGLNTFTVNKFGATTATSFIKSSAPTTNILLAGGGDIAQSTFQPAITGLTTNYLPKWNGSGFGNSNIVDTNNEYYFENTNGRLTFGTSLSETYIFSTTTSFTSFKKLKIISNNLFFNDGTTDLFSFLSNGRALFNTIVDNGVDKVQVNGTISASPATTANQVVVKSQLDAAARPYKVYTALLSQTGTNAPTAIILENTTGETPILYRVNVGVYQVSLTAPQSKTFVLSTPASNYIFQHISVAGGGTAVNISTASLVGSTITPTDGLLQRTPIEIRIYP